MLYNRHSDSELERAVYIDPANAAARAEMLTRTVALIDERSDEFKEIEMELEGARKDHASEIEELEADAGIAYDAIASLTHQLNAAEDRIAQLTRATDLV